MVKKAKEALNAIIERTGDVSRFSIGDIYNDIDRLDRAKHEMKTNSDLQQRIIDKVVEQNPEVLNVKEKTQKACYLLVESSEKKKAFDEKIKAINKMKKEYVNDLKEIEKQTGVTI